jgi:hypothetical protein
MAEPQNDSVPPEEARSATRSHRREQAACDALRALLRDHYFQHFGAEAPAEGELKVELSLRVRPQDAWATSFEPAFIEQIQGQIEDAQAGWDVYQRGRVFCFRCRSSQCPHSAPPGPLEVFKGYSSTGIPEWWELVQPFLEARCERVDQLYGDPPAVLALMQYGHDLKLKQLSSFGRASKTYAILGQVIAGYFLRPAARRAEARADRRLAVTFQAVEIRGRAGEVGIRLNPIAGGLSPEDWDELLVSDWRPSLSRACEGAFRTAEDIERRVCEARDAGSADELRQQLRRVPQMLAGLARTLEQGDRQSARRTRHAEQHRRPQRPVHKAVEDALAAGEGRLFYDEKKDTWIACGKQGRAHVFSAEGRHVTSFVLPPGGAEFRLRTHRWRALQKEETARFRALLAAPPAAPRGRNEG